MGFCIGIIDVMKYCFYRISTDSGFAPNPYYGYCTLAACTPNHMRANLDPGDVIVGVEADGLIRTRRAEKGDKSIRSRCIVYYMKIFEVLDLDRYFKGPRFQDKIPDPDSRSYSKRVGDNVYYRVGNKFRAIPGNMHDNPGSFIQDTKGDRVYISDRNEFYYFGDREVEFPTRFEKYLPKGHGIKYYYSPLPQLDEYVYKTSRKFGKKGRIGNPISRKDPSNCS